MFGQCRNQSRNRPSRAWRVSYCLTFRVVKRKGRRNRINLKQQERETVCARTSLAQDVYGFSATAALGTARRHRQGFLAPRPDSLRWTWCVLLCTTCLIQLTLPLQAHTSSYCEYSLRFSGSKQSLKTPSQAPPVRRTARMGRFHNICRPLRFGERPPRARLNPISIQYRHSPRWYVMRPRRLPVLVVSRPLGFPHFDQLLTTDRQGPRRSRDGRPRRGRSFVP